MNPRSAVDHIQLRVQYEALRAQAVAGSAAVATPLGLAVLVRRGLAAWLAVCAELSPVAARSEAPPRDGGPPAVVPAGVQAEVVRLLASLALAAGQAAQKEGS